MKQSKAIITTLLLCLTGCSALPVTSKALENNSDQLIWQTAWYSDARASPFTGDSKKISPKSIFITPNLDQSPASCPPGFKVDDNGKCLKVISINQDDLLVTRLQSFFSQHQTTDDSTSIDYDYDGGEEATHYDLPLIPIFNDTRGDQEQPEESFLGGNSTQDSDFVAVAAAKVPLANDLTNATEKTIADGNSNETRVNESDINSDQNDTTTVDESAADTTAFDDQFEDEGNYTTTTPNEFVIKDSEKPQAEMTISGESHLGDYFDAMLQNDSLIIDDSYTYENVTDGLELTTVEFDEGQEDVEDDAQALHNNLNNGPSEAPFDTEELSSSEKASTESTDKSSVEVSVTNVLPLELSSSEKASLEVIGLDQTYPKASLELSSLQKASQELLSTQKVPQELFYSKKVPQQIFTSQEDAQELLTEQKDPLNEQKELSTDQKVSQGFLNEQTTYPSRSDEDKLIKGLISKQEYNEKLSNAQETFEDPLNSMKPSQKLSNSQEASQVELNTEKQLPIVQKPQMELSSQEKSSPELLSSQETFSESPKTSSDYVLTTTETTTSKVSVEFLNKVPAHLVSKPQDDLPSYTKFVTVEKTSSKPSVVNGPFLIFGQPFTRPSSVETTQTLPENPSIENFEYSNFDSANKDFSPAVESSKPAGFSSTTQNKTETPTTNSPTTTQKFDFTPSFPYENRIIKDDLLNRELESVEESNKFVYHHLPATDVSSTPPVVRFPSQQRVRFPDEPARSSSFSWPRDNGLMRFWQEQPLINDFKIFSRGHSNFRRPSYRRNQ